MRALIQRVNYSKLSIGGKLYSEIGEGLLIFTGFEEQDEQSDLHWMTKKVTNLRIFGDDEGKMNYSVLNKSFEVQIVSQFTLHASMKKGNRPSFIKAAKPEYASKLYLRFCSFVSDEIGIDRLQTGVFGANMNISLENSGPVTIWLDSKNRE